MVKLGRNGSTKEAVHCSIQSKIFCQLAKQIFTEGLTLCLSQRWFCGRYILFLATALQVSLYLIKQTFEVLGDFPSTTTTDAAVLKSVHEMWKQLSAENFFQSSFIHGMFSVSNITGQKSYLLSFSFITI